MTSRVVASAALTAALALLPVLYLHHSWPLVPALVGTHFDGRGVPTHFAPRQWLWNIAWWPALAFVGLTFLPQVHAGQSFFWSSPRQRQARLVVVGALVLVVGSLLRLAVRHGRSQPAPPAAGQRATIPQAR